MLVTGGPFNPWSVSPDTVFAGHWGKNDNLRVWKMLLDEKTPDLNANAALAPTAHAAVEKLKNQLPPLAPGFPVSANAPTPVTVSDPWDYIPWAVNLVTAAEWMNYPFLSQDAGLLSWNNHLLTSGNPQEPFKFQL